MDDTMARRACGAFQYYTCTRLPVRHAFTTKRGGVSTGACESMNLGFGRGDDPENVRRNYHILADALSIPYERITMTKQVHHDAVTVVTEDEVYEVTLVGSGVITNKIADHDESVDEQTKPQVVTLADAIDAAAVANPGRVDEATISLRDGKAVYVVRIESESGMSTLYVDALSAELLGSEVLEEDEDPE